MEAESIEKRLSQTGRCLTRQTGEGPGRIGAELGWGETERGGARQRKGQSWGGARQKGEGPGRKRGGAGMGPDRKGRGQAEKGVELGWGQTERGGNKHEKTRLDKGQGQTERGRARQKETGPDKRRQGQTEGGEVVQGRDRSTCAVATGGVGVLG